MRLLSPTPLHCPRETILVDFTDTYDPDGDPVSVCVVETGSSIAPTFLQSTCGDRRLSGSTDAVCQTLTPAALAHDGVAAWMSLCGCLACAGTCLHMWPQPPCLIIKCTWLSTLPLVIREPLLCLGRRGCAQSTRHSDS